MNMAPAFSHTASPAFEAARTAVLHTLPLFEMRRMRAATTARRHPILGFSSADRASSMRWVNHFTHTHRRIGPDDREVVSPNNDTVFSNAWLDLSRDPVLIDTPDMGERYWTLGLLDAWTNPFAYVGRRTTGNRRQRTLVHGPAWEGPVPDGVDNVISASGEDVWVIGRLLVDDCPDDLEQAAALQRGIAAHRLDGGVAAFRVDTGLNGSAEHAPDASLYRATIDDALARNPVPVGEHLCWPVDGTALAEALPLVFEELRQKAQPHTLGGGWALPVAVRTHWGADVVMRARVARNFIGALGIEEAMYPTAEVDANGALLNGSHAYELRFEPGAVPEVDAFWSLTLYRRSDCLLVANPAHRYSVGDRLPGLRRGAGGSLSIRIQSEDPGTAHNWLPAPPGEAFFVVLRLYQPRRRHLEFRFPYPPLRRL